jgi:hypothetical protein
MALLWRSRARADLAGITADRRECLIRRRHFSGAELERGCGMAIRTVHCHVLQSNISVVTDLEGNVTRVICPVYDDATSSCGLKRSASSGGPLSTLLARVSEDTLANRTVHCDFAS